MQQFAFMHVPETGQRYGTNKPDEILFVMPDGTKRLETAFIDSYKDLERFLGSDLKLDISRLTVSYYEPSFTQFLCVSVQAWPNRPYPNPLKIRLQRRKKGDRTHTDERPRGTRTSRGGTTTARAEEPSSNSNAPYQPSRLKLDDSVASVLQQDQLQQLHQQQLYQQQQYYEQQQYQQEQYYQQQQQQYQQEQKYQYNQQQQQQQRALLPSPLPANVTNDSDTPDLPPRPNRSNANERPSSQPQKERPSPGTQQQYTPERQPSPTYQQHSQTHQTPSQQHKQTLNRTPLKDTPLHGHLNRVFGRAAGQGNLHMHSQIDPEPLIKEGYLKKKEDGNNPNNSNNPISLITPTNNPSITNNPNNLNNLNNPNRRHQAMD